MAGFALTRQKQTRALKARDIAKPEKYNEFPADGVARLSIALFLSLGWQRVDDLRFHGNLSALVLTSRALRFPPSLMGEASCVASWRGKSSPAIYRPALFSKNFVSEMISLTFCVRWLWARRVSNSREFRGINQ